MHVVESEFLSLTDTAAALGVCEDTARRWAKSGRLPPYRLLGRTVFRRADVERLRAERGRHLRGADDVG